MRAGHWNNRACSSTLSLLRRTRVGGVTAVLIVILGALSIVLATAPIGRTASGATPTPPPPLSVSNFVIVDPSSNVTVHGGSVSLAPGSGQHQFVFDTVGYRFSVINTSRVLVPGQYSTSVDTWLSLVNDPACQGGTTAGSAEIDQATYDPTGAVTSAAVQFQFRCYTGTYVYGTIVYQLVNTKGNSDYYLYGRSGGLVGFGNRATSHTSARRTPEHSPQVSPAWRRLLMVTATSWPAATRGYSPSATPSSTAPWVASASTRRS